MRHISYAETTFVTDDRLGALVLEYATLLAKSNSADTVTVPGRVGGGEVEPVTVLVGPASQITAWTDDVPFDLDVSAEVADLERRISSLTTGISTSDDTVTEGIDDFDDLA